ncbi:MAG: hypothetical protein A2Z79_06865 [Deltaproteobacteria bacterium GWA2_55_82]|nr:MAG: hypothetical protein A2Z79_06865 [Deltaproteobacteria bacterium GWA2_55_82]
MLAPLYDLGVRLAALPFGGEEALRRRLLDEAGIKEGQRVLEIFSGTATLSVMAARMGASVTALDVTHGMLKAAGVKAKGAGVRMGLVRGEAQALPFTDASFDRVIASMGLHEAAPSAAMVALGEAKRVIKDGGTLAILDFHRAEGAATRAAQSLLFTFFEGDCAKEWVRGDLQSLLTGLGFRDFRRSFFLNRFLQLVTVKKT